MGVAVGLGGGGGGTGAAAPSGKMSVLNEKSIFCGLVTLNY